MKNRILAAITLIVLLFGIFSMQTNAGTSDGEFFIQIDGLTGACTEPGFEGWTACYTVSVKHEESGRTSEVGIEFTHSIDKITAKIQQYCMNSEYIKSATIKACIEKDGERVPAYILELKYVRVKEATVFIENGEPRERVLLGYKSLTWRYADELTDGQDDDFPASFDFENVEDNSVAGQINYPVLIASCTLAGVVVGAGIAVLIFVIAGKKKSGQTDK